MSKMNIYEYPDAKGIVVSGDIHGTLPVIVHQCCVKYGVKYNMLNCQELRELR